MPHEYCAGEIREDLLKTRANTWLLVFKKVELLLVGLTIVMIQLSVCPRNGATRTIRSPGLTGLDWGCSAGPSPSLSAHASWASSGCSMSFSFQRSTRVRAGRRYATEEFAAPTGLYSQLTVGGAPPVGDPAQCCIARRPGPLPRARPYPATIGPLTQKYFFNFFKSCHFWKIQTSLTPYKRILSLLCIHLVFIRIMTRITVESSFAEWKLD